MKEWCIIFYKNEENFDRIVIKHRLVGKLEAIPNIISMNLKSLLKLVGVLQNNYKQKFC